MTGGCWKRMGRARFRLNTKGKAMIELSQNEIECVSGGVNWKLIGEGAYVVAAGAVAVGAGAISGPVGLGLVIVGSAALAMGGTAVASGWGDASNVSTSGGCERAESRDTTYDNTQAFERSGRVEVGELQFEGGRYQGR
jgi:hypothetical protein